MRRSTQGVLPTLGVLAKGEMREALVWGAARFSPGFREGLWPLAFELRPDWGVVCHQVHDARGDARFQVNDSRGTSHTVSPSERFTR